MKISTDTKIVIAGGVVALVALWYAKNQVSDFFGGIGDALGEVGDGIANGVDSVLSGAAQVATAANPASENNLLYRASNAVGSWATGDKEYTVGGWIYDVTHR